MANTKSAEKRIRQNAKRRERNRSQLSKMRTVVKRIRVKVADGEVEEAAALLPQALKIIDMSANKRVIHSNTAARTKSRLVKAVSSSQTSQ